MKNKKHFVLLASTMLVAMGCVSFAHGQETTNPQAPLKAGANCPTAPHDAAKSESTTKEQADAILAELKQIRELLEKQQAQIVRAAASPQAAPAPPEKVQLNVGVGWHVIGRDDAPVTLVEFADYQCPFCKKFESDAYAELKKNYIDTGKVRFVSRDLPLDFHPYALKAAEAARCAGDQGKYWELREAIISDSNPPTADVINRAAEAVVLEPTVFQTCLASEKYKADVQKDAAEAAGLQISGTPTFILAKTTKEKLDGVRMVGAQPFASFQSAIDNLLKAAPSPSANAKELTADKTRR